MKQARQETEHVFWHEPFIYRAVRKSKGREITGTSQEIGAEIGRSQTWVRDHARNGKMSPDGWMIYVIAANEKDRRGTFAKIYIAENPEEDPIVGTACEIADLIGITPAAVYKLCKEKRVSRCGWSIRLATKQEAEEYK